MNKSNNDHIVYPILRVRVTTVFLASHQVLYIVNVYVWPW